MESHEATPRTLSGATYSSSLQELALPLPELLQLHPHLTSVAVGAFVFSTPSSSTSSSSSLLLIRRALTEPAFPGLWEVPGGGVEAPPQDATLLDAVVREVKEETGLTVTNISRCYGWVEFPGRRGRLWRKWNFEVEVAEPRSVVVDPLEHDAWRWVDGESALEAAGLEITVGQQRDSILEAFRIRREEGGGEAGHAKVISDV